LPRPSIVSASAYSAERIAAGCLLANDGTGVLTLTDMRASFAIATGGVLSLFIAAPPNSSAV
jgi:hypothetical protein